MGTIIHDFCGYVNLVYAEVLVKPNISLECLNRNSRKPVTWRSGKRYSSRIVKTNSMSSSGYSMGRPGLPVPDGITRCLSFISDSDMNIDKLSRFLSDLLYSGQFFIFLVLLLI